MPVTYKKIASVTVGAGGTATIQFTSIPSTYTDLIVHLSARTASTGNVWRDVNVRLNGSTTSLTGINLLGTGSAAQSGGTGAEQIQVPSSSATASTFGSAQIYISNYAGSTNKSFSADSVTENNATTALAQMTAALWSNTATVTSIDLVVTATTFVQHSTAVLYGISKS
jgi:hypothetical protein